MTLYPGEDPVQLISYTPLTKQPPSTSADEHQSASEDVRKLKGKRESRSLSGSSSDGTFDQLSFHRYSDSRTHEQRRREIREKQEVKLRSFSESVRSDVSIETMYQQIHLFITTRWSTN